MNPRARAQSSETGYKMGNVREEMFGRKPTGQPTSAGDVATEVIDRTVDIAIVNDLVNGGNEISSIFDGAKNLFRSADNAGSGVIDGIVGTGAAEHSTGFIGTLTGILDGTADGLSGIGDTIGDAVGGILDSAI